MNTLPTHKLGLAMDPASLKALEARTQDVPEAALRGAAKQFEALFLNMMLKSMRDTVPEDGALDSQQSRMFTGMLDEQYANDLSQGHGLGLADMIVRQLGPLARGRKAAEAGGNPASVAAAPGAGAADTAATTAMPAPGGEAVTPPALPAAGGPARRGPQARAISAFRAEMGEAAQAASATSGIPADFMLAQAGLESGWGQHQPLTAAGTPSYNLFGIKAGPGWRGPVARALTTEVVDGVSQQVRQDFRAYRSYAEAFQDYAALLSGSARYARAFASDSAQAFAGALQKAGYATDPDYAGKVARAIRQVTDLRA